MMHLDVEATLLCSAVHRSKAFLVFDLQYGAVDWDLTDYGLYGLDDQNLSELTVHGILTNLIVFKKYLKRKDKQVAHINSALLLKFRDEDKLDVLANGKGFGQERKAEDTVNKKLICVYRWLLWMQQERRVPPNTIGPQDCQVLSAISSFADPAFKAKKRLRTLLSIYPLLFRSSRATDRHEIKPLISRTQKEIMVEKFMRSGQTEYVRRRNALLTDIAAETGFRRASINSLRVDQFDPEVIRCTDENSVVVQPMKQKFGYVKKFEFPLDLALQTVDFIEGPLQRFLDRKGLKSVPDRLFLSEKTGEPLTDRAITAIMSKAARAAGSRKGTAGHALRRLFAQEQADLEVQHRVENGLDTGTESVGRAVAGRLGQNNWESILPYVSNSLANVGLSRHASLRGLRDENARLAEELRHLKERNRELEVKNLKG